MNTWKNKIFDDAWKYLIGLAGGSSITGFFIEKLQFIPLEAWFVVLALCLLFISFALYWSWPQLIAKFRKRRFFNYWESYKEIVQEFYSAKPDEKQKKRLNKKYKSYRRKLRSVMSTYHLEIKDYLEKKYKNNGNKVPDLMIGNFKSLLHADTLEEWQIHAKWQSNALNNFDNFAEEVVTMKF